jgi:hypothetical protein
MKAIVPLAVALVVVSIGTFLQGIYSERWGRSRSDQLAEFTARLSEVPMIVGDWVGDDEEVDEEQFARSNCDGHVSREYVNSRNGKKVSVYLVSGSGRHVTIHTPDWCYRGAGYEMDAQPNPYTIPVEGLETDPEFRTTTFTKHEVAGAPDRLRIFWTFTDDGVWQGPSSPKPVFGARDAMFKAYFITKAPLRNEAPEDSPTCDFVKEFMPVLNKVLFAATPESNGQGLSSADPNAEVTVTEEDATAASE